MLDEGVLDLRIAEIAGVAPRRHGPSKREIIFPDDVCERIPFVESKAPDWARIAEFCALSERAGRWANFGPVSEVFATAVQQLLQLPADRVVVPASSATTALRAVAGMHASRAGRPLHWAISAFGFFSGAIGPFADRSVVVDCDSSGRLDLEHLARLPWDRWDGLLTTNVFGLSRDYSREQGICRKQGKPLIIDSAVAFPGPRPSGVADADEVISFHHTKPWGFGEGGCAVVKRQDGALVRSFLNYGVGADAVFPERSRVRWAGGMSDSAASQVDPAVFRDGKYASYATNGKMSDLAAAAILERLERMPQWSARYHAQRHRIRARVEAAGLRLLSEPPPEAICPHLPVLAPAPVALVDFPEPRFAVGKYYRPLASDMPVAARIYSHIINVPCHPGMAAVNDEELDEFLGVLTARSRA